MSILLFLYRLNGVFGVRFIDASASSRVCYRCVRVIFIYKDLLGDIQVYRQTQLIASLRLAGSRFYDIFALTGGGLLFGLK